MKKLLLLATALSIGIGGTMTVRHAAAAALSDNAKTGCTIVGMQVLMRIDQMDAWMNGCSQLQAHANGDPIVCTLATLAMYNQTRGRSEFDKPPLDIRKAAVQGCFMLTKDATEDEAKFVASKVHD